MRYLATQTTNDASTVAGAIFEEMVGEEQNNMPFIGSIYSTVKRYAQKFAPVISLPTPLSGNDVVNGGGPIDPNAYYFFGPNTKPRRNAGKHRSVAGTYNVREAARWARANATLSFVKAHLAVGDDDHIALTLVDTLFHPSLRKHTRRALKDLFSDETSMVGRVVVGGVRAITNKIAASKNKGMLSRESCSLVSTLMMSTVEAGGGTVSKAAIGRQLLPGFSDGARKRIMKKASLKRKSFDKEGMLQFRLVDEDTQRMKSKC